LDNTDNLGEIYQETSAAARSYRIQNVMRKLQTFGKDRGIHVCCLWQVSANVEDKSRKKDHKPRLSDLAFSDTAAAIADWILFVYRASYYNQGVDDGETELILGARRGGGDLGSALVYKDPDSEKLLFDPKEPSF